MINSRDLAFLFLFAGVWPLVSHFVTWPAFVRRLRERPAGARPHFYRLTMFEQWTLVAIGVGLWISAGRAWPALGLQLPAGWRWLAGIVPILGVAWMYGTNAAKVASSETARASVRAQLGQVDGFLPRTRGEFSLFVALSITAGVCEEFLFRGYFIWMLAPWLTWWGAAALAAPVFGLSHAYQGRKGIVQTSIVAVLMTLVVAASGSLVPAMILHAAIDAGSGALACMSLRPGLGDAGSEDPVSI